MKTGLIVAMSSEYEALRRAGVTDVIKSGIGKAGAARAATEFILTGHPDCIINSGCAGGIGAGVGVFDIVLGKQTAYHDVWCGEGNLPGQVQGLPQRFDADPSLLATALGLQTGRRLHSGLICTGDQFLTSSEEDARVLDIYPDALACDMESTAIAQVCRHYGVPFLSFRIISDARHTEKKSEAVYNDFWQKIGEDSFAFVRQLLESL